MDEVAWPDQWQAEARQRLQTYFGSEARVRIVLGDPEISVDGTVMEGHVYLDDGVPTIVYDVSGRPDVHPWRLLQGPVLRIYELRARRKPFIVFANPGWRPSRVNRQRTNMREAALPERRCLLRQRVCVCACSGIQARVRLAFKPLLMSTTPCHTRVMIFRTAMVLALLAMTFGLAACGSSGDSTRPNKASSTGGGSTSTQSVVPAVVGQRGDAARTAITAAGFKPEFESDSGKAVFLVSNWTVVSQDPAARTKAPAGSTVTLRVTKPDAATTSSASQTAAASPSATPAFSATYATVACDRAGKNRFPYGFKAHWITGKLNESWNNGRWFLKVTATVTNAASAKRDVTVECYVKGTADNPVVTEFLTY